MPQAQKGWTFCSPLRHRRIQKAVCMVCNSSGQSSCPHYYSSVGHFGAYFYTFQELFWNKKHDLNRYCDWDHIILLRINSRFYQTEREHSTVDWYHVSLAICTVNEIHHLHAIILALNDIDALNSVFKTSRRFRVGFVEDFLIRPCGWKLRFSLYCSKWLPHIQKCQILLFCKYTRCNHCKEDHVAWYPTYQNFCLPPLRAVLHSIEYAYIRKPALMSGNFILK